MRYNLMYEPAPPAIPVDYNSLVWPIWLRAAETLFVANIHAGSGAHALRRRSFRPARLWSAPPVCYHPPPLTGSILSIFFPSYDSQSGFLMGAVKNGAWLAAEVTAPLLLSRETYTLYSSQDRRGSAQAGRRSRSRSVVLLVGRNRPPSGRGCRGRRGVGCAAARAAGDGA